MSIAKIRDQAYIRQANTHAVLKTLRDEQPISRRDMIQLTGMSPTSITRIVSSLLDSQLVTEGKPPKSSNVRGRKAILLRTNPDAMYTLGFMLDRDFIRMNLHNFDDQTLYTAEEAVGESASLDPKALVERAHAMAQAIPREVLRDRSLLRGIGVSISGTVDDVRGIVVESIRMRWQEVDLRTVFERVFGLPTWIENDVKACLIGEKDRLGIPRSTDAAYLYLGKNGIGVAATTNGMVVRGKGNAAGEIAHMVLSPSDIPCSCGKHGCLQLHLLETYLVNRAQRIDPSIQSIDGILDAYRQRISFAEVLLGDFKRHLLLLIALLDSFFNPAKIIVTGTTMSKLNAFIEDAIPRDHVILTDDYVGASVHGVSIIAMQQTLIRRLAENDEAG